MENIEDKFGTTIDRIDNLIAGLNLPMGDPFHVSQLKVILPEISEDLKKCYVELVKENPWE